MQFGFRGGLSTVDAIFALQAIIKRSLDSKNRLYWWDSWWGSCGMHQRNWGVRGRENRDCWNSRWRSCFMHQRNPGIRGRWNRDWWDSRWGSCGMHQRNWGVRGGKTETVGIAGWVPVACIKETEELGGGKQRLVG